MGNSCTPVCNIRLPFLVMMPFILCGPKREEIIGEWRIMHNEELRKLYSSNIFQVFKSRTMRWPGHVMYGGEDRYGTLRERTTWMT